MVIVFLILSVLLFCLFKMVPGDPARMMVEGQKMSVSPEKYEMLYQEARARLGLDKPLVIQYFSWFGNMLRGDFGYSSVYRIPVLDLVGPPMRNTVCLNLVYYVILFLITIPLGIKAAVKQNSPFDNDYRNQYPVLYHGPDIHLPFRHYSPDLSDQWYGDDRSRVHRTEGGHRLSLSSVPAGDRYGLCGTWRSDKICAGCSSGCALYGLCAYGKS